MTAYDVATIAEMRGWIADCYWEDLDAEEIDDLTDEQVVAGVKHHYNGGIDEFVRAM